MSTQIGLEQLVAHKRQGSEVRTGAWFGPVAEPHLCGRKALAQAQSALRAEQYVAPLYNSVIASGGRVVYREVPSEAMIFCGTPDEYVVAQRRYVH